MDDSSPSLSAPEDQTSSQSKPAKREIRKSIWNKAINRRNSREWALQMLFRLDITPPEGALEDFFKEFWDFQADVIKEINDSDKTPLEEFLKPSNNAYRLFAEALVRGVWDHRDQIDAKIESYITNWTIPRMGGVDRNVLRIAIYELFFCEETPPIVIINEAIDVAKYFSTRESGKFVNGILDRASHDVTRSPRDCNSRRMSPKKSRS